MAARRRPSEHLTPDELADLTAAVAEGRRATVYLREAVPSLNLAEGASARVISVSGSTVLVKPKGVDDELPYEADELRRSKNPPPPPARAPRKKAAPKSGPSTASKAPAATKPSAPETTSAKPAPATAKPTAPKTATPKPATRKAAGKTKSVCVTVFGTTENEWSVAVTRGVRKPQRSRAVSPEAVEAAVSALGDDTATDAVTSVLHAAREQAAQRVQELSRELEEAKRALAELQGR